MKPLTHARLTEAFHYDKETGHFIFKIKLAQRVNVGDRAGADRHGYWTVAIDNKRYAAHRLAWLYVTGRWPCAEIDHIDGVKDNNKWANLREATHSENRQNQIKPYKTNKAGHMGVCWHNAGKKWRARITVNGKDKWLGLFETPEAASIAYLKAKQELHISGQQNL